MSSGFLAKLADSWPASAWCDVTVLVAVSGGADSVALARGLAEIRVAGEGRILLAHYNHRLRGAESDADQGLVEALGAAMNCQAVLGAAATAGALASEAAAREARYAFLVEAAAKCGARYIATGHTADDQVETVLFNILRGTGLAGLAGIPRVRAIDRATTLIRPLLAVSRDEVLGYLQSIGQVYREDSTNLGDAFARNRIRRQLLPLLEREHSPGVRESLRRLAQIAGQANEFLDERADELVDRAVRFLPALVEIDLRVVSRERPIVVRQALLRIWQRQGWPLGEMSLEKWEQVLELVAGGGDGRAIMVPGGIRVERNREILRLKRDEV